MSAVLAASEDCIKVLDLEGRLSFMSEGGQRVMEVVDFEAIRGCAWPDFWEDAHSDEARAALAAAREGRSYRFHGPANTAAGNPRYWDVQVSPIIGSDGAPEAILSVSRDITELRASEERYRTLASELNHRIKNLLAMVQGIVNQTLRQRDEPPEVAKTRLSERLQALGAAQDLLMSASRHGADLKQLVETVLAPHRFGTRIRISGPALALSPKCALAMALATHELGTNAMKYGALSHEAGHVEAGWQIEDGELHFRWQERGGPPVEPPVRRGFGSQMIEKALGSYFGGQAQTQYAPDGIVLTLRAPVAGLAEF